MKVSNYNFFFPYEYEEGKYIAYNSLSNSMALINEDKYNDYLCFEKDGTQLTDLKLLEDLKLGGFILKDDIDELSIIRHNMYAARFDRSSFGLTIAPTSDCNFRCIYCYEKDAINNCYMSEETENNIVKMLEQRVSHINHFHVTWYGGEPLLAIDTIKSLSNKFIKICNDNKIAYSAGIVTNGYNLTKKNWSILRECRIDSMQITIDGDANTHNKRRPLKNGQDTFHKIIKNLVELKDNIIPVTLRINVDKTNKFNIEEVLKILHENKLTEIVIPYLARVDNFNDCYEKDSCLGITDYEELKEEFFVTMAKYNYDTTKIDRYKQPKRKDIVCGCDRLESYIINSDGEIFKCWDDIGKNDISIGNVNIKNSMKFNKTYLDYIMFDPTNGEKCKQCKYVPICMGGCPYKRLNISDSICEEMNYKFHSRLNNLALQIKNTANIQDKCCK